MNLTIAGVTVSFDANCVCIDPSLDLRNPHVIDVLCYAQQIHKDAGRLSIMLSLYSGEDDPEKVFETAKMCWDGAVNAKEHIQQDIELCRNFMRDRRFDVHFLEIQAVKRTLLKVLELPNAQAHEPRYVPGYVYLVQSPTGAYKIGRAQNIDDRLKTFNVKLPFEVELIHTIKCDDYHKGEKLLHERYAHKRGNGEWFMLDDTDVAAIKAIKRM